MPKTDMEPLALSFMFTTFEHRALDEADLVEHLDRLHELFGREPGSNKPVELSGFVSMKHGGIELLGDPYWVEDVRLLSLGGGVDHFGGRQFELRSTVIGPDSDLVLVELFEQEKRHFERTITRATFEQEWQLLRARAERIRESLGDPAGTTWLNSWHKGWPAAAAYLVPKQLRDYYRNQELTGLLTNPRPNYVD